MTKLAQLRKLAEARTDKGKWVVGKYGAYPSIYLGDSNDKFIPHYYDYEEAGIPRDDANFIATFANHAQRLLDVVECADKFLKRYCEVFQLDAAHKGDLIENFEKAMKALESET